MLHIATGCLFVAVLCLCLMWRTKRVVSFLTAWIIAVNMRCSMWPCVSSEHLRLGLLVAVSAASVQLVEVNRLSVRARILSTCIYKSCVLDIYRKMSETEKRCTTRTLVFCEAGLTSCHSVVLLIKTASGRFKGPLWPLSAFMSLNAALWQYILWLHLHASCYLFGTNWKHFYFVDHMTMSTRDYCFIVFFNFLIFLVFIF